MWQEARAIQPAVYHIALHWGAAVGRGTIFCRGGLRPENTHARGSLLSDDCGVVSHLQRVRREDIGLRHAKWQPAVYWAPPEVHWPCISSL